MVAAIVLQLLLPDTFAIGARYLLPVIELLLLIAMSYTTPHQRIFQSVSRRVNVFMLLILTGAANVYSLIEVANRLINSQHIDNGRALILTALNIFLTNVIIFGLWYWEMDGGGPGQRLTAQKHEQDFLFPQNRHESYKHPDWQPIFIDYLYVSGSNATAFSSSDTLPLSRRAKMLMMAQASISLVTLALVAARAVGILS
jgi:hypothetical protein